MKQRRRGITDLSNDLLKQILIHVAQSSNGPLNFARTLSVCRLFKELVKDKMVLRAVTYNNASLPLFHPSLWQFNGLVVWCICYGNVTALEFLGKHATELHSMTKALMRESMAQMLDLRAKIIDVNTVNTRSRHKAFELATKKCEEQVGLRYDLDQKFVHLFQALKYVKSHLSSGKCLN